MEGLKKFLGKLALHKFKRKNQEESHLINSLEAKMC